MSWICITLLNKRSHFSWGNMLCFQECVNDLLNQMAALKSDPSQIFGVYVEY